MTRLQWVSLGIALSALVGGCGLFGGKDETEVVVQPVPVAPPRTAATQSTASAIGSLTQPTNPDERLRGLKSGRIDPFAALLPGLQTSVSEPGSTGGAAPNAGSPNASGEGAAGRTSSPEAPGEGAGSRASSPAQQRVAVVPRSAASGPATRSAPKTQSSRSSSTSNPGSGSSGTRGTADSNPAQTVAPREDPREALPDLSGSGVGLPPLPQAELAKGVQVSGFAIVAGVPRAIVKAPDERTSRSVSAGDRLSNGQVLVKEIDFTSEEPVLILEQSGTRVAVAVGKPGTQIAAASEATPSVPALW